MTLSKQLLLIIAGTYLLAFCGTFALTLENTRSYVVAQFESHAQDAATALGLSLSSHTHDVLLMESMVDALLDRGHYMGVRLVGLGNVVILERTQPIRVFGVPAWFVALVKLRRHKDTRS